jgi:hypothetical protein
MSLGPVSTTVYDAPAKAKSTTQVRVNGVTSELRGIIVLEKGQGASLGSEWGVGTCCERH